MGVFENYSEYLKLYNCGNYLSEIGILDRLQLSLLNKNS